MLARKTTKRKVQKTTGEVFFIFNNLKSFFFVFRVHLKRFFSFYKDHSRKKKKKKKMSISNEELFETFNLSVNDQAAARGHEWIESIDGEEPLASALNTFLELPPESTGKILHKKLPPGKEKMGKPFAEATNEDTLGIPLTKLLDPEGPPEPFFWRTLDEMNHMATLHISEWSPAITRTKKALVMLHGVPTSDRWKAQMGRRLARLGYTVYAVDMPGMGRSSKIWDYTIMENGENVAWDWKSDVYWLERFINLIRMEMRHKEIGLFADDWGAGIALRYIADHPMSSKTGMAVSFVVFTDPIWSDGYFVFEIGSIGGAANLLLAKEYEAFDNMVPSWPQTILVIEKGMVRNREKFNRWTESTFIDQYRDARYQEGRIAQEMGVNYLNLALLAMRSGRLAPRQLQPFHKELNPYGVDFVGITLPVYIVWGDKDQMMPPSQALTAPYLFPNAKVTPFFVPGADHFAEIDNPEWVAQLYSTICQLEWGKENTPVYIGGPKFLVYKGDEAAKKIRLTKLYGTPSLYNDETLKRLAENIERGSKETEEKLAKKFGGKASSKISAYQKTEKGRKLFEF
jgi:pimeloyl-ACP methyl ester carboxylesterase